MVITFNYKTNYKQIIHLHVNRAVTKMSSCQVYAISRRGIEQLGSSFGYIFLLFPMKVAGGHAHSRHPQPPALSDSPDVKEYLSSPLSTITLLALPSL